MHAWNGVSLLECLPTPRPSDVYIETDASGSWGCGALFNNLWFQLHWSTEWKPIDIMARELCYRLKLCCLGPLLPRKILEFNCSIQGLVEAIAKGSSKEPVVMHLLRCLWFFSAFLEITIRAAHIPGALNTPADKLSGNQAAQFLCSYPNASHIPTQIPTPLLRIMSPICLDWTSQAFMRYFRRVINFTR